MAYSIQIPSDIDQFQGYVYKLWYQERFVIVKCKTLWRSVDNITKGFSFFLTGTKKAQKEEDYYHEFFVFVQENPFNDFRVEVILQSNNPLELLICEQKQLNIAKYDPRCMNNNFSAYIPKFTQVNGKKSWINRGYYLNFMQWKKKQTNRSMTE